MATSGVGVSPPETLGPKVSSSPKNQREELIKKSGAKIFEPMPGRPMREYIVVPKAILGDQKKLAALVKRAHELALTLPPKKKKQTKSPAARSGTKRNP